ncbi:hypothetical protein M231_07685 [Tremella mesenterica]|uniref:O-methyltransferase n=1 Tax=Tremella mesenterica TaxID=5217 RepID=A0A4Q1BDT0_TREME|nr:hypothetical protein M231_07685 [Tremella mesenterica]
MSINHGDGPSLPPDTRTEKDHPYTAKETDIYLKSKLLPKDDLSSGGLYDRIHRRGVEAGMPDISVTPLQGQYLGVLARAIGAKRILEIGTLAGFSTIFLARALPTQGVIDTLELSPLHAKIAQENFLDADLYPFPRIHLGPALETLRNPNGPFARLPDEEGYDLIFIDADKEQIFDYFLESLRLTRKGGVVIVDNAIRGGRISRSENDNPRIDVSGLRALYDWVEKDAGRTVLMSGIQTVSEKFWE